MQMGSIAELKILFVDHRCSAPLYTSGSGRYMKYLDPSLKSLTELSQNSLHDNKKTVIDQLCVEVCQTCYTLRGSPPDLLSCLAEGF